MVPFSSDLGAEELYVEAICWPLHYLMHSYYGI